ncbi:MAG: hypothetical protein RIQ93_3541 [Verrucomicrobiota bacterium]|jgi:uncharacterized membrane protein YhiD involved in acid resistance
MPDFLISALQSTAPISPVAVLLRLATALALGGVVSWIYRRTRGAAAAGGSFPGTLVLLAVLIAMVTQVIGDNVARAFSLVGALSIVRFRTVVRDTQDTAYVIFAVVVGMAVGAQDLWVAGIGLVIVAIAAWFLRRADPGINGTGSSWLLNARLNIGLDPEATLGAIVDAHASRRELVSAETGRQGIALDVVFELGLRPGARADRLVQELNRIEGVQDVSLKRHEPDTNNN